MRDSDLIFFCVCFLTQNEKYALKTWGVCEDFDNLSGKTFFSLSPTNGR
jgi:hypothetical protein